MSLPYTSGDFTTPRAGTESWIEYPFIEQGDSSTKVYHLVCVVNEINYTPIALNIPMITATLADVIELPFVDTSAYFVGDYNKTKIEGGLVRFDRQFANIPASRSSILTGTSAYTFPGVEADKDDTIERTASGFSATSTTTTLTCTNTVTVGDTVLCSLSTTDGSSTITVSRSSRTALAGTNSSQVVVDKLNTLTTFVSGSVEEFNVQPRGSTTLATGTFTDFTYYLPGVTSGITVSTDVPLSETFRIQAPLLSPGTVPSATEYDAKVTNGDLLLIESSITRYAGNIIQRANVKVKAQ